MRSWENTYDHFEWSQGDQDEEKPEEEKEPPLL
jgi:hypothetical protein